MPIGRSRSNPFRKQIARVKKGLKKAKAKGPAPFPGVPPMDKPLPKRKRKPKADKLLPMRDSQSKPKRKPKLTNPKTGKPVRGGKPVLFRGAKRK